MSTVTKLGAYGLAVAAAFAVALAVLVTAPRSSVNAQDSNDNTPTPDVTIEAYTEVGGIADNSMDQDDIAEFGTPSATPQKKAGDSVAIQVYDLGRDTAATGPTVAVPTLYRFSVNAASGASGTFKSGGGTALNCADNRAGCDLDEDIDDLIVQFEIDDDAPDYSNVVIDVQNVNANKSVRVVIAVSRAPVPKFIVRVGSLDEAESRNWPTAFRATPTDRDALGRVYDPNEALSRGMSRIWVRLEDKNDNTAIAQPLTITSNNGLVFAERFFGIPYGSCGSIPVSGPSLGTSYCDAQAFDGDGFISVWGTGRPGVATVTFATGSFTETVEITLFGPAKKITAEADQSSVQAGGSVFVVATVTDGAGNAVGGHIVTVIQTGDDGIKAPAGDGSVAVDATNSVEKDVDGTANDLPACSAGTNSKGKCVVRVTAPNPEGTANDATRGTHTITLQGSDPIVAADRKVKVNITVAAAVETIETDAPARVDLSSRTEIKVTLKDDAGVLAGAQAVKVSLVGSGRVIGGDEAITSNGSRSFTYRAPNSPATAEFDIEVRALNTMGDAGTGKVLKTETISIAVGPAPEPPAPAQPTAAAISSNAPERVDPGSSTDITVTVRDADGDRAGMQSVTATKVSGDGRIINGGPAATADGRYTFTFRAASTTGVTEIDVDVRSLDDGAATTTGRVLATLSLTIQVGEPAPEMATLTPPPSGSGVALTAFSGGSLSDLQAVLLGECSSASVAAYATVGGNWVPYIPGARIAAVNAAFIAAMTTDGAVPAGTLLTVSGCD